MVTESDHFSKCKASVLVVVTGGPQTYKFLYIFSLFFSPILLCYKREFSCTCRYMYTCIACELMASNTHVLYHFLST